jgi:hypothetical protein
VIPDSKSFAVFNQMKKFPRFDSSSKIWDFKPYAELHTTADKSLFTFDLTNSKGLVPVLAGASYNLWEPDFGTPYAFAIEAALRKHLLKKIGTSKNSPTSAYFNSKFDSLENLPFDYARLAFRDVTNAVDARTTIICLQPPGVVLTHQSTLIARRAGDEKTEAYLLGVMSSIVFDWYIRRWVGLHLTYEILNPAPIPRPEDDKVLSKKIIGIAGRLACPDIRFTVWAKAVGVKVGSVKSDIERNDLIAQLDALTAHLYGLDEEDLIQIFSTYRRSWDYKDRLKLTIEYFKNGTLLHDK